MSKEKKKEPKAPTLETKTNVFKEHEPILTAHGWAKKQKALNTNKKKK